MTFTVSLPGTVIGNVRYQWLVAGALGGALSAGITAVDALFPWEFRIDAVPPAGAEELYAYDVTDATNYTKGHYQQLKVDVAKINGTVVIGTGVTADKWRA